MGWVQIAGYIISAAVSALAIAFHRRPAVKGSRILIPLCAATLLASLYPRVYHLNSTSFGLFMFEEFSASIVYINNMLNHLPTWAGATQMVYLLLMDGWRLAFGFSALAARSLSALFGYGAVLFMFLSVRRLVGTPAAWASAAFLSVSIYAITFSRLAIETGWTLFFFSLSLYVYARLPDRPRLFSAVLGFVAACGVFTYPGFTVWLAALAPFALYYLLKCRPPVGRLAAGAGGALLFAAPTLAYHFTFQAQAPLFRGGGVLLSDAQPYWSSLLIHLYDLFINGESYHLLFHGTGFVESSLWGFFLLGIWQWAWRKREPWAVALLGSMVLLPFVSALATNFPGMRRAIVILGPYYLFAGAGAAALAGMLKGYGQLAAGALIAAAVIVPFAFHHQGLQEMSVAKPFDRFSEIAQHPDFKDWLYRSKVKVVMERDEAFTKDYLNSYARLLSRYEHTSFDFGDRFEIISPADESVVFKLSEKEPALLIFEDRGFVARLNETGRVCIYSPTQIKTKIFALYAADVILKPAGGCPAAL